jgi:mannosidase alpha-like ER degradation enhancer 2
MNKAIILLLLPAFMFGHTSFAQRTRMFTPEMKAEMVEKVKEAASHAWAGYMKYAAGADDFKPLTKQPRNWYKHSMLMTPVDAYDTFVLLGLDKEAKEAKQLILTKLDFNVDNEVQVFEITIRQLGALITAYEGTGEQKFLDLAKDLADRLMPAFNTPTGMPYIYVNLQTGKVRDSVNNPAEIGTLMMEFGKLSKLTKDEKYYNTAKKAIMAVYSRRSSIDLVGEKINVMTGEWVSTESHISGYIDSYYEYLYKSWLLFGDKDFKKAFDKHNAAIKKYLVKPTMSGDFLTHVNMNTGEGTTNTYGALDAFYAGLCAYAGDVVAARKIQRANYFMWTNFNMEPEEFIFSENKVTSPYYILRPENLESTWYLYHLTEEDQFLHEGKRMVDDILKNCRTEDAFASIKDVKTMEKYNSMESFFFAETLKYAYLIFAPQDKVDLKKIVFNTEAHAFKISKN